jgi:hypothetical protein
MLAETVQRCCSRSYALLSSHLVHSNIPARRSRERVSQKIIEATEKAGV